MDARLQADTKIADSKREFQMRSAEFDQEVNTKKAEAELAYQLQVCESTDTFIFNFILLHISFSIIYYTCKISKLR